MVQVQGKPKAPQENLIGETLCNDEYYVHRIIGHGGMGKVYLAAHSELTVPIALKQARADQPLPESVIAELDAILQDNDPTSGTFSAQDFPSSGGTHTDRFLREALFLARMRHPALPSLYDYFFEDGYWYLVMDYIPGQTLTNYLRQQGPLPPLEALNYALQLCDVFDYLHKQSPPIIFRDLKPSNVLVTPEGTLMLVDFGIARYFKTGQSNDTTDFGSPGYASPEQYQTEGQTDGRSDLFSLGVLLYEMISGQRPVAAHGVIPAPADAARAGTPPLSAVLSGLITLATRTEPMYRFQSAHTFFLALERAYVLEEQRTYQQRVILEQVMETQDDATIVLTPATQAEKPRTEQVAPTVNALDTVYKQKIREVLQEMRRGRVAEEDMESELATMDKSLEQRASMELPLFTLPTIAHPNVPQPVPLMHLKARRLINASFVIVLVVCLVLASLLALVSVSRHAPTVHGTHAITPVVSPVLATPQTTKSNAGTWQPLASLPSAQADNTAVYVQVQGRAYLYVNGGYRGAKVSPHYDHHLYRYDIAAASWEVSADAQFPGMVNNAVVADGSGQLFYTVGYSTDTYTVTSLLYKYRPVENITQKIVPPPEVTLGFGNSMVADTQGHLYVTQGFTQSGDTQKAGTGWYRYDIATSQWHVLAPLPVGLGYVALAAMSDTQMVLIGGAADAAQHEQTSTIFLYNTSTNAWTQASTNAPGKLSGAASCVVQSGQLVVIGGYDATRNTGLDHVWRVDLHTLKWTQLAPLPTGGSVLGAAASDGKGRVFLVRGASDPTKPTADFWEFTIL